MNRQSEVVDIHSHLYPRWYIERLKERTEIPMVRGEEGSERFVIFPDEQTQGSGGGRGMTDDYWSVDTKLAFMDRHGIDRAIVSLGNPWFDPFPDEAGLTGARRLNDDFAELAERTHGRITGMGAFPGHGIEAVVTVIDEVAQRDGLAGAVSGTRIAGHTLDDRALDPVWAALDRTGVPLLLHPHSGSAMDELAGFGHALPVAVAFPLETTVALARLVMAGVLHRHPGLRIVASHGGGTLPYLAGRLDAGWRSESLPRRTSTDTPE